MNRISKSFAVFIILIIVMSCLTFLTVKPANAQSTTNPPVPQFSLKYMDASYDVSPSYSTNPYTGENITHAGYHVDNRTIQITIVNSNFALSFGNSYFMYYDVQIKGHNVENWTNLFPYVPYSSSGLLPQSGAQYTVISESVQSLPTNVPLDFRVQSFLVNQTLNYDIIGTSDWSSTQTVTITALSNPTPTPTVPEFPVWIILLSVVSVLFFAVYFKHRRTIL